MKKTGIDDFAIIRKLGGMVISPSGKKAAFAVTEGKPDMSGYRTDLWVYDETHSPALFRLTAGEDGKTPVFENEDTILFPAARNGEKAEEKTLYYRISLNGGEAVKAFELPFPASGLYPLQGGTYLVQGQRDLNVPAKNTLSAEEKEEEKDYEVFDELPFWFNGRGVINKLRSGLYLADPAKETQELMSPEWFDTEGFAVREDEQEIVYWGSEFESLNTQKSRMYVRDMQSGAVREIGLQNRYRVSAAVYTGNDIIFAASTGEKYGTSENPEFYLLKQDGSFAKIADLDPSLGAVGSDIAGGGNSISGGNGIFFLQTVGYRSFYRNLSVSGEVRTIETDLNIVSQACGCDPVFVIGMEKDRPQEFYVVRNGATEKVSCFNEEYVNTHEIAETEHFTFLNREGTELDGWILKPVGFAEDGTYPAVFDVHGGPQVAYGEGFFHEMQYWAAEGYVVFFCNPRGSSGKGGAFADIYGDNYGVRDYNDLMDFTDEVLRRVPQIDPAKVAMTGGSYGGFMANWIIGHTDRFAAVASQRSISNYISKCLTTDIGYYHNLSAIQADPWTSPQKMWEHSPLAYADRAKTPTLFIQSDQDYRCWMGDAVQMLQALLMHGVPARMCLFHGENHELSRSGKPKHRIRRLKEITQWFDRYCKGEE